MTGQLSGVNMKNLCIDGIPILEYKHWKSLNPKTLYWDPVGFKMESHKEIVVMGKPVRGELDG